MADGIDSLQQLEHDAWIIKRKSFLKLIYSDFYKNILLKGKLSLPTVELGSGGGFIKEIYPRVITSDIIKGPNIDKIIYAENIPFKPKSISIFFMIDVLHHIKNPEKAFREMERCLKPQGRIIMIEPYNSLWGGFIYKHFHREHFDTSASWIVKGKGRMSDSNTALPWIIFIRDRKIFEKKFPNLKIVRLSPHTPFAYLISGGLTKFQFLPDFVYPTVRLFEKLISLLNPFLGMFVTIEIQKIQ